MINDLTKVYSEWRKAGEGTEVPFTWDCGEISAREDFSNYANLDEIITFEDMIELENNYQE